MASLQQKKGQSDNRFSMGQQQQNFEQLSHQYHQQSSAYYASARLWDDGVIDPAATQKLLAFALNTIQQEKFAPTTTYPALCANNRIIHARASNQRSRLFRNFSINPNGPCPIARFIARQPPLRRLSGECYYPWPWPKLL